ncbi:SfnB family sulfur acquisition oxidoreductase [Actinoplanes octamycinicus]|uniref:SfnB family sulfur acquisition oxidoreductase n=1 Tax=Actinoplanes octamycinicus TaxID=135948 RepID=A0A7W7GZ95_9ACTN|nr:acyl-CoA dehydrogenase family protein [Actinoplanes octamycinicus]MBB4741080.1 SfnB family sulfur acquisition oxidoreductase [Actinoplanes octamycinicus]GIE55985.1 SfnB family sulfur acquisition oxidoreductase [Actinoplanes octamycinicus]
MSVPQTHDEAVTAAHRLAAGLAPGAIQRDRDGATVIPSEALAALDSSGLLAITVPVADGGPGLGPRTLAEVGRVIAAADPSIAQVPQAHFLLVDVLAVHGGPEARKRLFGEVLAGRRFGNALAERGGKHAQDLRTKISGGLLDGVKYYTTGALTSAWIAVSALDEQGRLVLAFVARDAAGVAVDTDWDVIGQRATISGTATFTGVPVEPGLRLDYAHAYEQPQQLGARAQLYHAAIEVGIAGAALADARDYLRTKARPSTEAVRAGASTAADDPHVRHRYGRLASRVRAAEALLESAARTLEEVTLFPADADAAARGSLAVAAAKAFGSEIAVEAGSELFQLCGTSSAAAKYDLDRHWRNARTHSVHDPLDWKYAHIAAYELADVLPPNHGQL